GSRSLRGGDDRVHPSPRILRGELRLGPLERRLALRAIPVAAQDLLEVGERAVGKLQARVDAVAVGRKVVVLPAAIGDVGTASVLRAPEGFFAVDGAWVHGWSSRMRGDLEVCATAASRGLQRLELGEDA